MVEINALDEVRFNFFNLRGTTNFYSDYLKISSALLDFYLIKGLLLCTTGGSHCAGRFEFLSNFRIN